MKRSFLFFIMVFFILLQFSCKEEKKVPFKENKVLAIVGNTKITEDMLDRELLLYQKINPGVKITGDMKIKVLNNLINRYILIEEAKREKLDTSEEFLEKIKRYWEESLIQLLYKKVNDSIVVVVSESEIKDFYNIKSRSVDALVWIYYTRRDAESGKRDLSPKKSIHFFDINSSNLPYELKLKVKDLKEGEVSGIINSGDKFYIVKVLKISNRDLPPLEKIHDSLKSELIEIKKQEKFDRWLMDLRNNINVKIFYKNLR